MKRFFPFSVCPEMLNLARFKGGQQIQTGGILQFWGQFTQFFHSRGLLHSARQVTGDFYDLFALPGGYIGFVMADVGDKGVDSALFMALSRSLIRVFSGQAQLSRTAINVEKQTVGGDASAAMRRHHRRVPATISMRRGPSP
jgi:serine phosphatase RsbU (regulator of sigma subunit)